jgi:hypothetical protein
MEPPLFIGLQASGKSSVHVERLPRSPLHLSPRRPHGEAASMLERPAWEAGFDRILAVRLTAAKGFAVEEWPRVLLA